MKALSRIGPSTSAPATPWFEFLPFFLPLRTKRDIFLR